MRSLSYSVCYRKTKCEFVWCLLPTHVAENSVGRDVGQRSNANLSSVFVTCIYSTVLNIRIEKRLSGHISTVRVFTPFLFKKRGLKLFPREVGWQDGRSTPPPPRNIYVSKSVRYTNVRFAHLQRQTLTEFFFSLLLATYADFSVGTPGNTINVQIISDLCPHLPKHFVGSPLRRIYTAEDCCYLVDEVIHRIPQKKKVIEVRWPWRPGSWRSADPPTSLCVVKVIPTSSTRSNTAIFGSCKPAQGTRRPR